MHRCIPLPTNQPKVTVASINGTPVPANPAAAYTVPGLSINNTGSIPIVISTTNIPNTTIYLYVTTDPPTTAPQNAGHADERNGQCQHDIAAWRFALRGARNLVALLGKWWSLPVSGCPHQKSQKGFKCHRNR